MKFVRDIKKFIQVLNQDVVIRAEEYEDDEYTYEYIELSNGQKQIEKFHKTQNVV